MSCARFRATLIVAAGLSAGCKLDKLVDTPVQPAGAAARLALATPPPDVTAGAPFALTVIAVDSAGNVVSGFSAPISVSLAANPGGDTLSGTATQSSADGAAHFEGLSLTKAATGYTIRASGGGLTSDESAPFAVAPGAPAQMVWAVQPTVVQDDSVMRPPIRISLLDAYGNAATNFSGPVALGIGRDGSGTTATLGGTTSVTATNGVVTFDAVHVDQPGTGFTLRASMGDVVSESAPFDVTEGAPPPPPGGATHLGFTTQPTSTQPGASLGTVRVAALDQANSVVTSFSGTVTVVIGANPGRGTLSGTVSVVAQNGVATFTNLSIDKAGNGYTLTAGGAGLTPATSDAFNIAAPPPPPPPSATHLSFTAGPSSALTGATLGTVRVSALDGSNATVTSLSGTITVAIGANPGGGTLSGTVSVVASSGVATFANLSIDKAGNGYTLTAGSSGLTGATSASFNVTAPTPPPVATHLVFTSQPSNVQVGRAIPTVQVSAVDDQGNVVTGFTGAIAITLAHDASLLGNASLGGTTSAAAVNGVATFTNLTIDQIGIGYTLGATTGGLAGATSASFTVVTL